MQLCSSNYYSQNNLSVALFVFGEGLQNNHHHDPRSARFSIHWWEPDFGYGLCLLAKVLGMVKTIHQRTFIP